VLIDSGSSLNVLFTKTLKKMGLDVTDMLTKTNSLLYSIVPGNATVPPGQVVLPIVGIYVVLLLVHLKNKKPITSSFTWTSRAAYCWHLCCSSLGSLKKQKADN
jgi:hypothetical protein